MRTINWRSALLPVASGASLILLLFSTLAFSSSPGLTAEPFPNLTHTVGDEMIDNGTFDGGSSAGWIMSNSIITTIQESGSSGVRIYDGGFIMTDGTANSSGEYSLSLDCYESDGGGYFKLTITPDNPQIGIVSTDSVCDEDQFVDIARFFLLAGERYVFTFETVDSALNPHVELDNIKITKVTEPTPLNTIIDNGDFQGIDPWILEDQQFVPGEVVGRSYVMHFPTVDKEMFQNFIAPISDTYDLEFECLRRNDTQALVPDTDKIKVHIDGAASERITLSGSCGEEHYWLENSFSVPLNADEAYTLTFESVHTANFGFFGGWRYFDTWVDNVQLVSARCEAGTVYCVKTVPLIWKKSLSFEESPAIGNQTAIDAARGLITDPLLVWDLTENGRDYTDWDHSNGVELKKFEATFNPDSFILNGRTIADYAFVLRSPYFSNSAVPVYENIYVFLNGVEVYRGGQSYAGNADPFIYPETEGGSVPGIRITGASAGNNLLEVIVETSAGQAGSLGELELRIFDEGLDTDRDALPDIWEVEGVHIPVGGDLHYIDLPAMGADPNHKDIFVEVDYMEEEGDCDALISEICVNDNSFRPKDAAMQKVIDSFGRAPIDNPDGLPGITLHIDYGSGTIMDPKTGKRWGALSRSDKLEHQEVLGSLDGNRIYDWSEFNQVRNANFESARRPVFYYAIFADRLEANDGISGYSKGYLVKDFVVSLGAWAGTTNEQAGTFMHEIGHNLGLNHGGQDDTNYKPNYLSVMNYAFQTSGLRINGQDGYFDYSRLELADLDETDLDEAVGLEPDLGDMPDPPPDPMPNILNGYGTKYFCGNNQIVTVDDADAAIDWNCTGPNTQAQVEANINHDFQQDGTDIFGTLRTRNDWNHLIFPGDDIGKYPAASGIGTMNPFPMNVNETVQSFFEMTAEEDALIPKSHGVSVDVAHVELNARTVQYTFKVENRGLNDDIYALSWDSSAGWTDGITLPDQLFVIAGQSAELVVTLTVPDEALPGDRDESWLTAVSQNNAEFEDSRLVVTFVPDPVEPNPDEGISIYLPYIDR